MAVAANVFNLIDEAWLPTIEGKQLSLADVFSSKGGEGVGGNPMQKIALTKLLLAIAQAACPLKDDDDWKRLDLQTLGQTCRAYLQKHHAAFWLYGERPFLQMPAIAKAIKKSCGVYLPDISTGNTTILQDMQKEVALELPEQALLVVVLSGYCLAGKQGDNSIVLSPGYTGKLNDKGNIGAGRAGAWVGGKGYLHHFLQGQSILETIKLNLLTQRDLPRVPLAGGLGTPPWERMPAGEDCETARALRSSLMGCLVPLSKFVLLGEGGIKCTDGIKYPGYLENYSNPSVALKPANSSAKAAKAEVLWVETEKLPWRTLPALLSFANKTDGLDCAGIYLCLPRAREEGGERLGIWAGGLAVTNESSEQKALSQDDFVDSLQFLPGKCLGELWFSALQQAMGRLEALAESLGKAAVAYYKEMHKEQENKKNPFAENFANRVNAVFWEYCNYKAQELFDYCDDDAQMDKLEKTFLQYARQAFAQACPKDTVRQLTAWGQSAFMVRLPKNSEEAK